MSRKSKLLDDLTSQIGYAETIELLRAWGGRRLQVPNEIPPDHPIALSIGHQAAKQLCYFYGATELELPAERTALLDVRNACILQDLHHDSVRSVAIRYGVTPRHVRHIRKTHDGRLAELGRRAGDAGGDLPPSR